RRARRGPGLPRKAGPRSRPAAQGPRSGRSARARRAHPREVRRRMSERFDLFATCPRGLEALLVDELVALGALDARAVPGGVAFRGDLAACYSANLGSRFATRVLLRLGAAPYRREQDVYDAALALPWPEWFGERQTIRVDVNATRSPLKSLDFATLRIKDAVCDRFRADRASIRARPTCASTATSTRSRRCSISTRRASRSTSAATARTRPKRRCARTSPPASWRLPGGTAPSRCSIRCAAPARS